MVSRGSAALAVLMMSTGDVLVGASSDEPPMRVSAQVVPVIYLDASSMRVHVAFENTSNNQIHYLLDNDGRSIHHLQFLLSRGEEYVMPIHEEEPPELSRERIRQLKPGRSVFHTLDLRSRYGELKSGRYLLRVRYQVAVDSGLVTEFGITPGSIDHAVTYIDIQ